MKRAAQTDIARWLSRLLNEILATLKDIDRMLRKQNSVARSIDEHVRRFGVNTSNMH